MAIELKEIESSNLSHIGHEAATKTLYVRFKSGATWSYAGVPEEEYQVMLGLEQIHESLGKHFAKHIRPLFPATQIFDESIFTEITEKEKS